jgi:porin
MATNTDNLFPVPGDSGKATLSEFYFTQALSEKFILFLGKMDLTSMLDSNAFAYSEKTQFMNLGLRVNPALMHSAPYTAMAAAVAYMPTKWLTILSGIADNDPEGAVTKTGFNTAFHGRDWYSVAQEYDFTIKPWGKEGHQRFGWAWTSRDFTDFEHDNRLGLSDQLGPIRGLFQLVGQATGLRQPTTNSDDWVVWYNFDQYVFTEADDPKQGFGLFGRLGYTTGESNPVEQFYSIGVGGQGILPERDRDTYGLGYYYLKLSEDLPEFLHLDSEQGVELYYNFEVTPWFHVTPNLQVIVDPGGGFQERDTAIVYGIRGQMTF